MILKTSKKIDKRSIDTFSLEILEISQKILNLLLFESPKYRPPKNIIPWLEQLELLIKKDLHTSQEIISLFEWVLKNDAFWCGQFLEGNPALKFRKRFLTFEKNRNSSLQNYNKNTKPKIHSSLDLKVDDGDRAFNARAL